MRGRLPAAALAAVLALAGAPLPAQTRAGAAAAVPAAAAPQPYDLPAAPLAAALSRFAAEAGVFLSSDSRLTEGRSAPALRGRYTVEAGFAALLAGTGLRAVRDADGVYTLQPAAPAPLVESAAPPVPAEPSLPTVVVTATADRKEEAYEAPKAVSVITREEMDRVGARHVTDILQATPGVTTVTNEQIPSVTVNIRGLKDFGRVNMNIDGMRQNYQRTGHQQRNGEMFFDPELLSSVEIEKGPSSGAGGAGVIGGVASFNTLGVDDIVRPGNAIGLRLRSSIGVGSWKNGNDPSGSAVFAFKPEDGRFDFLAGYSRRHTGDYEPGKHGEAFSYPDGGGFTVPADTITGTGQSMTSYLGKLGWNLAPRQRLQFTATRTEARFSETSEQNYAQAYLYQVECANAAQQGQDMVDYCDSLGGYDMSQVYPITSTSHVVSDNLGLDYSLKGDGPLLDLKAKLYRASTRMDTVAASENIDNRTRTDTYGGFLTNRALFELASDWLLTLDAGGEAFLDRTQPEDGSTTLSGGTVELAAGITPRGRRLMTSVFAKGTVSYRDWLQIMPGLRYDYYRLWGLTGFSGVNVDREYGRIDVDHRDGRLLPTLGLAVEPTPGLQFFTNAGLGWRPPAITETLVSGAVAGHVTPINAFPNYLLVPERSRTWDVGFNARFDGLLADDDRLRVKLTHFHNRTTDYAVLTGVGLPGQSMVPLNPMQLMYVNSTQPITFLGEELEASYAIAGWTVGLRLTRLEREGTLSGCAFPLGGAANPEANRCGSSNTALYFPKPPEWSGALDLARSFAGGRVSTGLQVRASTWSGAATAEDENADQWGQKSYWVLDLYGEWLVTRELRLGLNLRNLIDRQYAQTSADAMVRTYAPGRSLVVSLQYQF